ncbi:RnfABCDGE type electron transport complex subunit B [Clostridium tagluense]|uniref:RnfABCDGE type electron transport complex subunit B n=1 Tax=Clostridium tagluense TaxID=360422 RepID=UPI001CF298B6|nr:RnfABCDGE type electron transport complex subunit B [Clostridium tagluense]MCB2311763.1 RnfABCDGE type electron transport complex subunit B [Clostridium tagluense]MCB2316515.1 RnfABCDGE type electron transport complex subunit B [Clostridium tagluense]MCB2321343.1 RnfABCDGE type electron transport complex subunit B [Clostridium tagluense]MCB2326384.1 RnfABCDGE type electron transport complex subunit B [Clostridium tagluense]MCB2331107.1 RnfABCDGE type electron transport complex subunit B [Cl
MDVNNLIYPIISIGGMGLVFGVVLGYANKKFHVPVDPKVPLVREALPSANCGACGFAGCDAYAAAVVEGDTPLNLCSVGGASVAEKIGEILGLSVETANPQVAFVKCKGTCAVAKEKYEYDGIRDCRQAVIAPGEGPKACSDGCLGFASCVRACEFSALHIIDGVAVVYKDNCVACGACIKVCPKNLIELVPASQEVLIECNSKSKGKSVKENCGVGCIACTMCVKVCPSEAITMVNNLATIDFEKCTQCGLCSTKCPTKAISKPLKAHETMSDAVSK